MAKEQPKNSEEGKFNYHYKELSLRIKYIMLALTLSLGICLVNGEYLLSIISVESFTSSNIVGGESKEGIGYASLSLWGNPSGGLQANVTAIGTVGIGDNQTYNEVAKSYLQTADLTKVPVISTEHKSQSHTPMIFTEIGEGLWSYLACSCYLSLIINIPLLYYHLYNFLLPGLSYREHLFFSFFFTTSIALLFFAHLITYFVILPSATSFFLTFQTDLSYSGSSPHSQSLGFANGKCEAYLGYDAFHLRYLGRILPWTSFVIQVFSTLSFFLHLPLFLLTLFILFLPIP